MLPSRQLSNVRGTRFQRDAFALLTTILLIAMLVAVSIELTTLTATHAVSEARRHQTLAHDLAVDSALLLLADQLASTGAGPSDLIRRLDLLGRATATFEVGEVAVHCTIYDDAAKFNPNAFQRCDRQPLLKRKLTSLASRRSLPRATVDLKPLLTRRSDGSGTLYRWYDQFLSGVEPGSMFRWNEELEDHRQRPVWSDVVTFWGDGRIDLRRVDQDVLEAVLEDIRPGLARLLLAARPADRSIDFAEAALTRVHAEIRQKVAARLTYDAHRYAIRMDTAIGADRRRWYVVAEMNDAEVSVLHRSRLTW